MIGTTRSSATSVILATSTPVWMPIRLHTAISTSIGVLPAPAQRPAAAASISAFHRLSKAEEKLSGDGHREEWEERNRIFHEVLIGACPPHWIKHFLSILYHQAERYRRLALQYKSLIHRDEISGQRCSRPMARACSRRLVYWPPGISWL